MNKIAKEKGLDLTDPRQRREIQREREREREFEKNAAKGNVNNPMGILEEEKTFMLVLKYEPIGGFDKITREREKKSLMDSKKDIKCRGSYKMNFQENPYSIRIDKKKRKI